MISRFFPVVFTASRNAESSKAFIEDRSIGSIGVEFGQDRRERGAVEAALDTDRRKDYRHAERRGGLGQKPDMQLDQVRVRLRADDLEHLILIVDQHQGAVLGGPDTQVVVMVALLGLVGLVWVRGAISAMRPVQLDAGEPAPGSRR